MSTIDDLAYFYLWKLRTALTSGGILHTVKTDPETMMARHPQPWPWVADPVPVPWIVSNFVSAVQAQQLAKTMQDGAARSQLEGSAQSAIDQVFDDYCGTPPRLIPWPWPGPPPWAFAIASELTAIAESSQGGMREGLLAIAGRIAGQATESLAAEAGA